MPSMHLATYLTSLWNVTGGLNAVLMRDIPSFSVDGVGEWTQVQNLPDGVYLGSDLVTVKQKANNSCFHIQGVYC